MSLRVINVHLHSESAGAYVRLETPRRSFRLAPRDTVRLDVAAGRHAWLVSARGAPGSRCRLLFFDDLGGSGKTLVMPEQGETSRFLKVEIPALSTELGPRFW